MNNKQGFTLVELLAVIVVLAVILVIAIPNVIKIIDKAKLDVYKRNEDMLINAAQKYMASQGISLNNGEIKPISYSQLKSEKLIDEINDQTDNNSVTKECSNSKVIVTKTVNGYTYKPGLVCTNYISLDTFNIIKNGDFSNNTTGWVGTGATISANNNVSITTGNGTQTYLNILQNTNMTAVSAVGKKLYFKYTSRVRDASSNRLYSRIEDSYSGTNYPISSGIATINTPIIDRWYDFSFVVTAPSLSNGYVRFCSRGEYLNTSDENGKVLETKDVIGLDLTDIYGADKEPTADQINNLINKSR